MKKSNGGQTEKQELELELEQASKVRIGYVCGVFPSWGFISRPLPPGSLSAWARIGATAAAAGGAAASTVAASGASAGSQSIWQCRKGVRAPTWSSVLDGQGLPVVLGQLASLHRRQPIHVQS